VSVYTTVEAPALGRFLARYPVGEPTGFEGIADGIENTNYAVSTADGEWVLTLFETADAAATAPLLHLTEFLAGRGLPCPSPVRDCDGRILGRLEGKPAALVTRLPGRSVGHPSPAQCRAVGSMLAQVHLAGRRFGTLRKNPRGAAWRKQTAAALLERLEGGAGELLREELRFQGLYRLPDLPQGLIHADLFRDNALFDGEALTGVVDFYDAGYDSLLYDVAVAVNDWCWARETGSFDDQQVCTLLAGYAEVRPLTALERGAWPVVLRMAALRFWLSRLQAVHAPRAGALTRRKDPETFRRILQWHAAEESRAREWLAL
jgi:homoserine kinase type II